MTFDGVNTVTLAAVDPADVRDHFITVRSSLSLYPGITPKDTILVVTIRACTVETLGFTQVAPQLFSTYAMSSLSFSYVGFTQEPDCQYDLAYTIREKDPDNGSYSPLPAFLSLSGNTFTVSSTDPSILGTYLISIQGRVPFSTQS